MSGVSGNRLTFRLGDDPPPRLDRALARDVPEDAHLSRSRLAKLLADGRVRVGGAAAGAKHKAAAGAEVVIDLPPPEPVDIRPEAIPLSVVHEDADLLVIDKTAGMVVHPAPGSPSGTLVNALMHHLGDDLSGVGGRARPGIVHRIDKDTSGLLVVAKTDAAHHGLAAQFEAHAAERLYRAVCHAVPGPADPRLRGLPGVSWDGAWLRIDAPLGRHPTDRQRQAVRAGGRRAVTRARVVEPFAASALIECRLETGRTHQIRAHLAHVGHGLVGDQTYGNRRMQAKAPGAAEAAAFPRQALHAATLGFDHPVTGEPMRFAAPLPADLAALIDALRGGEIGTPESRPR